MLGMLGMLRRLGRGGRGAYRLARRALRVLAVLVGRGGVWVWIRWGRGHFLGMVHISAVGSHLGWRTGRIGRGIGIVRGVGGSRCVGGKGVAEGGVGGGRGGS